LFQWGDFTLHSGEKSWWRIDCDNMNDSELAIIARLMANKVGLFNGVSIPNSHPGSAVHRLKQYVYEHAEPRIMSEGIIYLVVDDVLTTGSSMEERRSSILKGGNIAEVKGTVIFARGKCPEWVTPIFQLT